MKQSPGSAEPIIRNYKNIECRDAVLAWDRTEPVLDEAGQPVTRWDGRTTKRHPVTGEDVPDETLRVPVLRYLNPRAAEWPKADYVVGNPPFIGEKKMRSDLGDDFVEAIRAAHPNVPGTADFVIYWWSVASELVLAGSLKRFGLITTKAITQSSHRPVVERFLQTNSNARIAFAIPNHPWVDSSLGAAVRIAMTVADVEKQPGDLWLVKSEEEGSEETRIEFQVQKGRLHADLRVGVNVRESKPLASNRDMCLQGVKLVGDGFQVLPDEREAYISTNRNYAAYLPRYIAGSDVTGSARVRYAIDFFGLTADQARDVFPEGFQKLLDEVKPLRDQNSMKSRREVWWQFGVNAPKLRKACEGIRRFIATSEVAKHRTFIFVNTNGNIADGSLAAIPSDDGYVLGVLSSRISVVWSLATGGRMGVGDDPRYQNGPCFAPFPFPEGSVELKNRIRDLAEQLDAHRKRQQELHPGLTMTGMYNVLEKLRAGEELSDKEKQIHEQGLVSVLKQIHDDLDEAVFAAYGWPANLTDEEILERLVALNAERAAEEARGHIRWLRPEFQAPRGTQEKQGQFTLPKDEVTKSAKHFKTAKLSKTPWPKERSQRTKAIQDALAITSAPITSADLAKQFLRGNAAQIEEILDALCSLGLARKSRGRFTASK